jgi:hypothetical protein
MGLTSQYFEKMEAVGNDLQDSGKLEIDVSKLELLSPDNREIIRRLVDALLNSQN